jgi:hypothetical protein
MIQHLLATPKTFAELINNEKVKEKVKELALNDSGFVFSPTSGQSFSVNATGLSLLRLLQRQPDMDSVEEKLLHEFEVSAQQLNQDLNEFAVQLLRNLP